MWWKILAVWLLCMVGAILNCKLPLIRYAGC